MTGKAPPKEPKRLTIFRAQGAEPLGETGMMVHTTGPGGLAGLQRMYEAGLADASEIVCLYRSPDPQGPSLVRAWFKGRYRLPPHTHDVECLYYVVSGSIRMGTIELRAGDGFFVGAGIQYSYVTGDEGAEILEFRSSTAFDIKVAEGNDRGWDRLVAMCEENRERWRHQKRPGTSRE